MTTRKTIEPKPTAPAPVEPTDAELQAEVAGMVAGCAGCGTKAEPATVRLPSFDLYPVVSLLLQHGDFTPDERDKIIVASHALGDYRLKSRLVNGEWPVYLVPAAEEITDHSPLLGTL